MANETTILQTIKLYNRYNDNIYLEKVGVTGANDYVLSGDTDYCRVIYEDTAMTKISAVDPSGGPFMQVGNFKITVNTSEYTLDSITEDSSGKFKFIFK